MPNLLGATLESDRKDFEQLWDDEDMRPDEIKIYPCQLLENAELYQYWLRGEYQPYTTEALIDLITSIKPDIPEYCRVNRIVRDIPSTNVVEGNKRTSLRQDIQMELARQGKQCRCVRCREVRKESFDPEQVELRDYPYDAGGRREHFLTFVTPEDRIAGFLRLSIPGTGSPDIGLAELEGSALVREVHVYGQSLEIGNDTEEAAQHSGLGKALMDHAETLAKDAGFGRLAVISALGTRGYYQKLGYTLDGTYMVKEIS